MAIKTALSHTQIGANLKRFHDTKFKSEEIPFQLMLAIGASETIIQRYREGTGTITSYAGLLIKGVLAYKDVSTQDMPSTLLKMKTDKMVQKANPSILLVSDGKMIMGYNPVARKSYKERLAHIYLNYDFFMPMWSIQKHIEKHKKKEKITEIKIAEKMAKLYNKILQVNLFVEESDFRCLNILMIRLSFCFFAEDTGIFPNKLFTESIQKHTKENADDLSAYIDNVFFVMDERKRPDNLNDNLTQFPYVNGGLFRKKMQDLALSVQTRKQILECGKSDWGNINPDIWGSLTLSIANSKLQRGLKLNYTSISNIIQLIGPLFLNELEETVLQIEQDFQQVNEMLNSEEITIKEFYEQSKPILSTSLNLILRMSKMRFFDPACSSGNFLVVTYKNIRLLEMRLLKVIQRTSQSFMSDSVMSRISISQFYGIDIDEYACEIAIVCLWFAEHQMNRMFTQEFGITISPLPLKTNSNIHHDNACRLDWDEVCPHTTEDEVFVMGKPPYPGTKLQEDAHKEDMKYVFGDIIKRYEDIDYTACWFYKLGTYIKGSHSKGGFAAKKTITQGKQASILWNHLLNDIEIIFTDRNIKWQNNTGVLCSIIVLSSKNTDVPKQGVSNSRIDSITEYLRGKKWPIITKYNNPLIMEYSIRFGNIPDDGGYLLLNYFQKSEMVARDERSAEFIRPYYGTQEFLKGEEKYCLWITDENYEKAASIPCIAERIESCRITRVNSSKPTTKALASKAYRFGVIRNEETAKIIIPRISSERREYFPVGYLDKTSIISDSALALYDAPLWLFGILTSKMHMTWIRTVTGTLETDYSYTASRCFNSYPFPIIFSDNKKQIEDAANEILDIRNYHYGITLAELYDPDKMPNDLREVHQKLDRIVENCYQNKPFKSDEERLECLFNLFKKMAKKQ